MFILYSIRILYIHKFKEHHINFNSIKKKKKFLNQLNKNKINFEEKKRMSSLFFHELNIKKKSEIQEEKIEISKNDCYQII